MNGKQVLEMMDKRKEKEKEKEKEMSKEELRESKQKILKLKENTNKNFIEIGEELFKVKKSLPHGDWIPWIEEELEFSDRTARRFIHIYQHPEKLANVWGHKTDASVQFEPIPAGTFDIIYADPPWKYDFSETESRKIEKKYKTLTFEEIRDYEDSNGKLIKDLPKNNTVLFLWATAPKLREALEVMNEWGFEYKTHAIWDKEIIGMGYWFRGQHELLLVGVKGKVSPPEESLRVSSIIVEKRTEHSKKPEVIYELIEKWFPNQNYIELFSRKERKNWVSWGNEIGRK